MQHCRGRACFTRYGELLIYPAAISTIFPARVFWGHGGFGQEPQIACDTNLHLLDLQCGQWTGPYSCPSLGVAGTIAIVPRQCRHALRQLLHNPN